MAINQWEVGRGSRNAQLQVLLCDDDGDFLTSFRQELGILLRKMHIQPQFHVFSRIGEMPQEVLARCELAFLDIDLEDGDRNGIDVARLLRKVNDQALIFFVTNFIDYAPAGYEVQAFRYILKGDRGAVLERYLMQAMETLAEGQEVLRLVDADGYTDLPLGSITYLEVLGHSVSIHSSSGDFTVAATLSGFEQQLESHGFLRIHKSFLVNMGCIRRFRSRECLLSDGTTLMVSEKNYAQQKQKYLLWKGLK